MTGRTLPGAALESAACRWLGALAIVDTYGKSPGVRPGRRGCLAGVDAAEQVLELSALGGGQPVDRFGVQARDVGFEPGAQRPPGLRRSARPGRRGRLAGRVPGGSGPSPQAGRPAWWCPRSCSPSGRRPCWRGSRAGEARQAKQELELRAVQAGGGADVGVQQRVQGPVQVDHPAPQHYCFVGHQRTQLLIHGDDGIGRQEYTSLVSCFSSPARYIEPRRTARPATRRLRAA